MSKEKGPQPYIEEDGFKQREYLRGLSGMKTEGPQWPDRRKRLIAKIGDRKAVDFLESLMDKVVYDRIKTPGFNAKHVLSNRAQSAATAATSIEFGILYEDEDDITFAELEKRNPELYNKIIDKYILRSGLDSYI